MKITKKIFAFLVVTIFTISYSHAQCPGNKVQMFKPSRTGFCYSKCVPQGQVQDYVKRGWSVFCGSFYAYAVNNNKIPASKFSVKGTDKIKFSKEKKSM